MEKNQLSLLLIVLLVLMGGIVAETPVFYARLLLLTIIIYFIVCLFVKTQFYSLAVFIGSILVLGIAIIIHDVLSNKEPDFYLLIFVFVSYSLILFIVWFLFHTYDKSITTKTSLRHEVSLLKRYVDNNKTVFTYNELMERSEYLIQSCKHNSEKYCFVTIGVKDTTAVTYTAIQHHLQTTLLETVVIPKFDLLGQDEEGKFIIILQNCNKEKAGKRITEYLNLLKEKSDLNHGLLCIDINEGE